MRDHLSVKGINSANQREEVCCHGVVGCILLLRMSDGTRTKAEFVCPATGEGEGGGTSSIPVLCFQKMENKHRVRDAGISHGERMKCSSGPSAA